MSKDTHGEQGETWVGFDLDGTLAEDEGWHGIEHIGKPVKRMCNLAKKLHSEGKVIKILTARVAPKNNSDTKKAKEYIEKWCEENLGFIPPITYEKDSLMETLYDDRAVQVIPNTGIEIEEAARQAVEHKPNTPDSSDVKALMDYLSGE